MEDNKTNQLIAKSLLEQDGNISVLLADDGQEGVAAFVRHEQEIRLVLMDLHMPVMNGYDAATEIRRISEHVPIVAMTADVIEGVKEKCRAHGITHYISKPFDPEHFVRTINAILHGPEAAAKSPCEFLDRAKGLRNLGGNAQAYEMVLGEFYRENAGTVENLSCALDEKRYADAVSIVHKIKGSAGSIGADRLHSTAARLQKAIEGRSHPEIQSLGQEFVSLLTDLLKRIRPA